jgi:hypothetical protein
MPMSDRDSYEIYAVAKKNWRLLTRMTTSGQAIAEATRLQHTGRYSAIQIIVRPSEPGATDAPPRLLYQFSRPGALPTDQDPVIQTLADGPLAPAEGFAATASGVPSYRSRWTLVIVSCGLAVGLVLAILAYSD